MTHSEILRCLLELEAQLHRMEVRRDPERLAKLLHPEFEEIGRSGRRYSREEVLSEFRGGRELPRIHAEAFRLAVSIDGVALLMYRSAHIDGSGRPYRWTFRSSLWIQMEQGWSLRFHQGTPVETCEGQLGQVEARTEVVAARLVPPMSATGIRGTILGNYCSFCGKRDEETKTLINGPGVAICDECARAAVQAAQDGG